LSESRQYHRPLYYRVCSDVARQGGCWPPEEQWSDRSLYQSAHSRLSYSSGAVVECARKGRNLARGQTQVDRPHQSHNAERNNPESENWGSFQKCSLWNIL